MGRTPQERFLAKVDTSGDCWVWTAANNGGACPYGVFWDGQQRVKAHRWSYEQTVGEIPAGLFLDHLCRNTLCVRPSHLEPVTQGENNQRMWNARTTCPQGHPRTERWFSQTPGRRICDECNRDRARAFRAARKAVAA